MMKPIISKCGYRCDLCLAFRPNIEAHPENQQLLSDGWHTYFGFRIQPEAIYCDGCLSENGILIDKSCPVRLYTVGRRLANCASCEDFICEKIQTRMVDFDEIQEKRAQLIPLADRERFIKPYENKARLQALRIKS